MTGLTVGRVRIVDGSGDPLRARLDADRLLSAAQLELPGLPPGAILVVDRLRDPLPGAPARLSSSAAVARWRSRVQEVLATHWRTAAHPAQGLVPADAGAVAFADWAELLACLVSDWLTGRPPQWWWSAWRLPGTPALSPALGGVARVRAAMLAAPAELPAMLELLAARGLAVEAARLLEPASALGLLADVLRLHAIGAGDQIAAALSAVGPEAGMEAWAGASEPSHRTPGTSGAAARSASSSWLAFAPESADERLGPAQRLLLGVALTLRRAPAVVRRRSFGAQLRRWWQERADEFGPGDGPGRAPARASAVGEPRRGGDESFVSGDESAERLGSVDEDAASATERRPRSRRVSCASRPSDGNEPGGGAVGDRSEEPGAALLEPEPAPVSDPVTWSGLAGAFYLVNVGIFLGLYHDFTSPRDPGITLDPWDFVALLAPRLLGPRRRHSDDALWPLLSRLSGNDRPGAGFRAPRAWRVPAEWLSPFAGRRGAWRWSAGGGRLRIVHPAGFAVVDVVARGEPAVQAARELRHYRRTASTTADLRTFAPNMGSKILRSPVANGETPGVARWADWVAAYAGARLRLALGASTVRRAAATVLECPGRIQVTPSRVDVTFAIDDLPVSVRIAGLDRSPGWIPAAGRHLAFHFQ